MKTKISLLTIVLLLVGSTLSAQSIAFYRDNDGDGWGAGNPIYASYPQGQYTATRGGDCNDNDYYINPGRPEVCGDGKDNNCNSQTDENSVAAPPFIQTGGGCGYATVTRTDPPSGVTYYWQNSEFGYSTANSQKTRTFTTGYNVQIFLRGRNDQGCWGPPVGATYSVSAPGPAPATPTVNTSVCGRVTLTRPDPDVNHIFYWQSSATATSTGNSSKTITLTSGSTYYLRSKQKNGPCWSTATTINYTIDQGPLWYVDSDGDGYGGNTSMRACTQPSGYVSNSDDLNDNDRNITNTTGQTFYRDADADTWGGGASIYASYPQGNYTATRTGDCDDNDQFINPDRSEVCGDGKDNNCDGTTDENNPVEPPFIEIGGSCGVATVTRADPPNGLTYFWQDSEFGFSTDHSEKTRTFTQGTNVQIFLKARTNTGNCWGPPVGVTYSVSAPGPPPPAPTADTSVCGQVTLTRPDPNNVLYTYYWQSTPTDESTGNSDKTITLTSGSVYYLRSKQKNGPCWSDAVPVSFTINQGATWYLDSDNDGHAVAGATIQSCTNPGVGYTTTVLPENDCDDSNPSLTVLRVWYEDADNDGLGDPAVPTTDLLCSPPPGFVANNGDNCPTIMDFSNNCNPVVDDGPDLGTDPDVTLSISGNNYVYTRQYQDSLATATNFFTANDDLIQQITYFDGVGRPIQQIGMDTSPQKQDIVTHMEYDDYGRSIKEYLPYVTGQGSIGSLKTGMVSSINSWYNVPKYENTTNPYSEKDLENSPLSRVYKQAAPGNDWAMGNGHEIELEYNTNTTTDNVRQFEVNLTRSGDTYVPALVEPSSIAEYPAGELAKNTTKDENHSSGNDHTTVEFTNKQGQVVLKRTYNNNQPHDTYYVYDDHGNLSFVLPPLMEATSTSIAGINGNLADLGYRYVYDQRNRLVEKQLPGKAKEYIVYNNADQPIMTQDVNQRLTGEWLFTKYDAFGRVAYTGKAVDGRDRPDIQDEVDALSGVTWVAKNNAYTNGGITVGYANTAYPVGTVTEVLTINYYDDYSFNSTHSVSAFDLGSSSMTHGLTTGSRVKVLDIGTDKWITTASYYDGKGRPIYAKTNNTYLGTEDIVESKLDFVGRVLQSRTEHSRNGETIVTLDNFTYDHQGRLLKQTQCVGDATLGYNCNAGAVPVNLSLQGSTVTTDQTASTSITVSPTTTLSGAVVLSIQGNFEAQLIAENGYDELGQLESKKVGGTADATTPLQTVNYTYNVRGWLTGINDTNDTDATLIKNTEDLFAFRIAYNEGPNALYNGNIAKTQWQTQNTDSSLKTYDYTYDALNRIIGATDSMGRFGLSGVQYDKNGNITTLQRQGPVVTLPQWSNNAHFGTMDDLSYSYTGNQLMKVADGAIVDQFGFKDDAVNTTADTNDDYTYDANGNMTKDDNKGIISITHNHLNLPVKVSFNNGGVINYVYDADGMKLKKTVSNGTIIEYANGYVYSGNATTTSIQFFGQPEGYISPDGDNWRYVYQYVDNVGNVRISYTDNPSIPGIPTIIEESNHYPFGVKHKGYNSGGDTALGNDIAQKWKYNSVEFEESFGLNLYEMDLRQYDPTIGRFIAIDPVVHYGQSTYTAFDNNPAFWADPSGADSQKTYLLHSENDYPFRSDVERAKENKPEWDHSISSNAGGGNGDCCPTEYSGPGLVTGNGEEYVNALDGVTITPNGATRTRSGGWTTETERYGYSGSPQMYQKEHGYSREGWEIEHGSSYNTLVSQWTWEEQNRRTLEKLGIFLAYTSTVGEAFLYANPSSYFTRLSTVKAFSYTPRYPMQPIKIHGNSLASPKPTWFYQLYDDTGTFLKNGITSQPIPELRYTKSFMFGKHMRNTQLFPNRRAAYDFEYHMNQILRGPLNKNMH
ncbi:DUF6443 domain-containing protein [Flagellimonas meridianipacifica]|uniref:RHS repeat-associated protein n=1 Tax=Flagellimonas meridianipacifica TaxID=1080225 RepID=A0A2T0MI50_9FLAO|nr:DUF6443 domain-containing protein [Allomuricauda pacifica]PRX57196.1 RHS repeat-associated protein [Allomuricauda pacifica]